MVEIDTRYGLDMNKLSGSPDCHDLFLLCIAKCIAIFLHQYVLNDICFLALKTHLISSLDYKT